MSHKEIINDLKDKKTLFLDNKHIGDEDVKYIGRSLDGTLITYLNLKNNDIGEKGANYLAESLKGTQISTLLLSNNNVGDEGAKYLAECLKYTQISELDLCKNNLEVEAGNYLAECLNDTRISKLNLSDNNVGDVGAKYLAECLKYTRISKLDLGKNNIGNEGAKYLADCLNDTRILELVLSNNCIEDEGAKNLAEALYEMHNTSVYLSKNKIGINGGQYFNPSIFRTKSLLGKRILVLDVHCEENYGAQCISQQSFYGSTNILLYNNKIGNIGAKYLNHSFQHNPIDELRINYEELESDDAQYLAQAFENITILSLELHRSHIMQRNGIEYLVQAFKSSRIGELTVLAEKLCTTGATFLAEFLREINIIDLNLGLNYICDKGVQYIASALKQNTIMNINLSWNNISSDGAKYLAAILKDTQITYINLCNNSIGVDGARYLASSLKYSQVTGIHLYGNGVKYEGYQYMMHVVNKTNISWINLYGNSTEYGIEKGNNVRPYYIPRNTTTIAYLLQHAFQELVSLNPSNEFEFIVPRKNILSPIGIDQYVFLIKTLKKNPKRKVHIFEVMCRMNCNRFDFHTMDRINEFIRSITVKFNTFISNNKIGFVEYFGDSNCVQLVEQFEDIGYSDVVRNLLLHRELFYVDNSQEILHPYVYKMLDKYDMPLYNTQLEPNKKEEIISYYRNHPDIGDVQEIIDLLESASFKQAMTETLASINWASINFKRK